MTTGDQPSAALIRQIGPSPAKQNPEPVFKSDQIKNVDGQPRRPGWKTGKSESAQISYSGGPADRRNGPFVPILERYRFIVAYEAHDILCGMGSFLPGFSCYPVYRAVFRSQSGPVPAPDEDGAKRESEEPSGEDPDDAAGSESSEDEETETGG